MAHMATRVAVVVCHVPSASRVFLIEGPVAGSRIVRVSPSALLTSKSAPQYSDMSERLLEIPS
jgi:hypothetical protein